jgi:hypothetical protein
MKEKFLPPFYCLPWKCIIGQHLVRSVHTRFILVVMKNFLPQHGDKCQLNPLLLITARGALHTEVRDQQSHQSADGSSTTADNAEPTGKQHYFGTHQSHSQQTSWHQSVITVNLVTSRYRLHNSSWGTTPHQPHNRGIHAALDVQQNVEGSQIHQLHIMK